MKIVIAILALLVLVILCAFAFIGVLFISGRAPEMQDKWQFGDAFESINGLRDYVRDTNRPAYIKTAALFGTLTDTLLDIEKIVQETPVNEREDER